MQHSLPQLPALTGIIFYIDPVQRPQKENYFFPYCSATIEFLSAKAKGQRCIFSATMQQNTGCAGRRQPGNR
jgi:hypothetical protein